MAQTPSLRSVSPRASLGASFASGSEARPSASEALHLQAVAPCPTPGSPRGHDAQALPGVRPPHSPHSPPPPHSPPHPPHSPPPAAAGLLPPPRPRRRFLVALPGDQRQAGSLAWQAAWRGFSGRLLRRWREAPRLVIGSGGAHGALLLGGVAAVVGGWGDAHVRRWLARRPRSLAGVSAGCIGAVGLALGLGPLRLAAMNARFPYADVFGSDVPAIAGGLVAEAVQDPSAVVRRLAGIRGLLRGASLRTVVRTLLAEAGLPDSLTFAQLRESTGPGVEVRILAVSLATLRLVVFSARTSPDVRVADAMVASMSIPGVFAPAEIPGWGPCVDGGVLDPLGLEAFAGDGDGPGERPPADAAAFAFGSAANPAAFAFGSAANPFSTVWVGKVARFEPSRRADSIPSVLFSCLAACAQHTQRLSQERRTGRGYGPAMVSVSLGVREGCDERDVAVGAFDLLRPPPVAAMLRDGLDSADGCVLSAFLLLVLSAAAAARPARRE
jgi:hypothetical protein